MEINKTYNEDCLITMGNMVNNFIDLTITSPPYDEIRNYNKGVGKITDKLNGYSFAFENIARELYRVTKKGGVVVWVVNFPVPEDLEIVDWITLVVVLDNGWL